MEATKEQGGILGVIRAPRLEDAGLEDCALSPKSIKQAFFKVANSIRSLVTESDDEESSCVQDPGPTNSESDDALVGTGSTPNLPGACGNEKGGGLPEVEGDRVGVVAEKEEEDEGFDRVVVPDGDLKGGNEKEACVDELKGLKIDGGDENEKKKKSGGERVEDEGKDKEEEPILVEAFL